MKLSSFVTRLAPNCLVLKVLALLVFSSAMSRPAIATSWIKLGDSNISDDRIVEIDKTSLRKYPGLVVFNTRDRSKRNDSKLVVYKRLFTLCRTRETWDVASSMRPSDSSGPLFELEAGLTGPTNQHLSKLARGSSLIAEGCKLPSTSVAEEFPVAQGKDNLIVLLPEETKANGDRVSVWVKAYGLRVEPFLKDDGTQWVIDNEPLTETKVLKESYILMNWVSDCQRDENAVAGHHEYDARGTLTSSWSIPSTKLNFSATLPGSVGRTVHSLACKLR